MRIIVVGLGNPILSDDSIGIKVAGLVKMQLSGTAGVAVIEAYAGGLRLMESMAGYDRAIIIDAVKSGCHPPGTIQHFSQADLTGTRNTLCTHDGDLTTTLALGRDLGLAIPKYIEIIGIEVEHVEEFSEELTARVAAALPDAVAEVLKSINTIRTN